MNDSRLLSRQSSTHIVSVVVHQDFQGFETSVKLLVCTRHQLDQDGELWTCVVLKRYYYN